MRQMRNESGVAMILAMSVLVVLLLLTGVVVNAATNVNSAANRDTREKRAFEAAQAGLQTTLYRLNMQANSSSLTPAEVEKKCIGGTTETLQTPSGTTCEPYTESLGNGTFYRTWASKVVDTASSCAGVQIGTSQSVAERCLTSQGIVCSRTTTSIPSTGTPCANAVIHRVQERAASFAGKPIFPFAGIFAQRGIQIENQSQVYGNVFTNGQLLARNSAGAEKIWLGPKATTAPIVENSANIGFGAGRTCEVNRTCPSFSEFATMSMESWPSGTPEGNERINKWFAGNREEGSVDTITVSRGGNRAEACVTGNNVCRWENKSLTIGNNVTWTVNAGTYLFCNLVITGGTATLAQGASAAIYIGGPSSVCPAGSGQFSMTSGAQFINNSPPLAGSRLAHNTTTLEIYIYTSTDNANDTYNDNACNISGSSRTDSTCINIGNSGDFYGTIFAPLADVLIANTGNVYGSIIGSTVTYNNNNGFYQDVNDTSITTPTLGSYYRAAWIECKSEATEVSNPQSGC
jgi:Tfp pilus assembly protein PilX